MADALTVALNEFLDRELLEAAFLDEDVTERLAGASKNIAKRTLDQIRNGKASGQKDRIRRPKYHEEKSKNAKTKSSSLVPNRKVFIDSLHGQHIQPDDTIRDTVRNHIVPKDSFYYSFLILVT